MPLFPDEIWGRLDALTKPPRSLGRLEELAARLCEIQQTLRPRTTPRRLVLLAADHGVVAAGVSAWPSHVTALMLRNIVAGKAASSVLARQTGIDLVLVDVGSLEGSGIRQEDDRQVAFYDQRIRNGSRNLAREPALTGEEFEQALDVGRRHARQAAEEGMQVVAAGEMGIGNTTPAACLAMLLADVPLAEAVGRGAGADEVTLTRKRDVVAGAVTRAADLLSHQPREAIASVAGLEIAAMAGFYQQAHQAGLAIVLDGYVATAAALVAEHLTPGACRSMIAAHLSAEPGHGRALARLSLQPFLDWNLRLGEGTGALALMGLLDAAAAIVGQMATLEEMGIAPKRTTP